MYLKLESVNFSIADFTSENFSPRHKEAALGMYGKHLNNYQ